MVTIKATWATELGGFSLTYYTRSQRFVYGFLDAFFQSFDTQLFPFAIWAGIHLPQLIARVKATPPPASGAPPAKPRSRHKAKAAARAARA